jgi:Peptidase family M23
MLALLFLLQTAAAPAPPSLTIPPRAATVTGTIEQVTLGPIFRQPFMCMEHPFGQLDYAGDALGSDCMVVGGVEGNAGFMSPYRTNGRTNADWYSWHAEVLAPVSGTVLGLLTKPEENVPGTMGGPPAAQIRILTADGIIVTMAHLADFAVAAGDHVTAGQVIGHDGNNGFARSPHIHVGAWRQADNIPLQIRWDLRALAATQE